MPGRIQSPSAQLGELLLRGWCMQAEACCDCQLPLMRDPATMLSHCVGCRKVYNADGDVVQVERAQATQAAAPQQSSQSTAAAAPAADRPVMNGPISNATSSSSGPAAHAAIRANGSLASATQQHQQPVEDPDFQLAQQRYLQMRHQREATSAAAGASRDPSQLLADKLLEGWTMLGQHCPICNSPLMRSRAMQVRCVVCDLPVQMEPSSTTQPGPGQHGASAGSTAAEQAGSTGNTAAAQRAAEQAGGTGSTVAAQAVAGHSNSTGSTAPTAADTQVQLGVPADAAAGLRTSASGDQRSPSWHPVHLVSASHVSTPSATPVAQDQQHQQLQSSERQQHAAGAMGHGGGNVLLQQQRVLSGLQRALLHKLDESRQLLAATAATQTVDLMQQLQVINQLMQTFAAVRQEMPR